MSSEDSKKEEVLYVKKPLNRAEIPKTSFVPRLFTGAQRFRDDSVQRLKGEAPHDFPAHSLSDRAKLLEDARYVFFRVVLCDLDFFRIFTFSSRFFRLRESGGRKLIHTHVHNHTQ